MSSGSLNYSLLARHSSLCINLWCWLSAHINYTSAYKLLLVNIGFGSKTRSTYLCTTWTLAHLYHIFLDFPRVYFWSNKHLYSFLLRWFDYIFLEKGFTVIVNWYLIAALIMHDIFYKYRGSILNEESIHCSLICVNDREKGIRKGHQ